MNTLDRHNAAADHRMAYDADVRRFVRRARRNAQRADALATRKPGQFHYRACLSLMGAGRGSDRIRDVVWRFENP